MNNYPLSQQRTRAGTAEGIDGYGRPKGTKEKEKVEPTSRGRLWHMFGFSESR